MVSWSLDIFTEAESRAQKGHATCLKVTWLTKSRSGMWTQAVWAQFMLLHMRQYVCRAPWISQWKWAHSQTKSRAISFNDNSEEGFRIICGKLSCGKNWEHIALANGMSTGWEVRRHKIKNLYKMKAEQHAFLLLFRPVLLLVRWFLMPSPHNRYLKSHTRSGAVASNKGRGQDCPDAKKEIIGS